jgi:glycosyltransferase involved in cell wall biosynthesis
MQGNVPRVSVGVPVYNGQDYLGTALESLLSQTFVDLELIICRFRYF